MVYFGYLFYDNKKMKILSLSQNNRTVMVPITILNYISQQAPKMHDDMNKGHYQETYEKLNQNSIFLKVT